MDPTEEIAEFLTSRRARVTPEQAGLRSYGERRVPGLRREEVAALAGVSLDYYKRLERGNLGGVSDGVLEGLAEALRLDPAERAHLRDLARAANPTIPRRRPVVPQEVRPAVTKVLDAISAPALVRNSRFDYIAANPLGRALYAPMFESREQPPNSARFTFLDPASGSFYPEWDEVAEELVAYLRSEAGRAPEDQDLAGLIAELSGRSADFRSLWAAHNVRFHDTGAKRLHHPIVGEITVGYETMQMSADPALTMSIFTVESTSASQDALTILSSWSASEAGSEV
ncbi:MAG TPA: helix-turn-helix transcriptional regulator [Solirubrobacterales bacterium]|nr:helix-turn-helix transcriptional regulator [Solirubrobacterales bacterium]